MRDDFRGFSELQHAFSRLGLMEEACSIFELLAAILHLGDTMPSHAPSASDSEEPIHLDERSLQWCADLLGVRVGSLRFVLTTRRLVLPGSESIDHRRSWAQAETVVRSCIVTIYKGIFSGLVRRMNEAIAASSGRTAKRSGDAPAEMATLDIYGFENLATNSLEQLLINFTNEKLQQMFVCNCIIKEQALYRQEGLSQHLVVFDDRSEVLGYVCKILNTLDDAGRQRWKGMGRIDDVSFCQEVVQLGVEMQQKFDQSARVQRQRRRASTAGFCVTHFAGTVEYSCTGWLDRNDACPLVDIEVLLKDSTKSGVRQMVGAVGASQRQYRSVSREQRKDLDALLSKLNKVHGMHYVRCFKPNRQQAHGKLEMQYLLEQLRNTGTLDLLNLMHQGYPNRLTLLEVAERFGPLLPPQLRSTSRPTLARSLMLVFQVPRDEWAVGLTHLFLKAGQLACLDRLKSNEVVPDSAAVQAALRAVVQGRWRRAGWAVRFALRLKRRLYRTKCRKQFASAAMAVLFVVRIRHLAAAAREKRYLRREALRKRLRACMQGVLFVVRLRRLAWSRYACRSAEAAATMSGSASMAEAAAAKGDLNASLIDGASRGGGTKGMSLLMTPQQRRLPTPAWAAHQNPSAAHAVQVPPLTASANSASVGDERSRWWQHVAFMPASLASLASGRRWRNLLPQLLQKRARPEGPAIQSAATLRLQEQPAKRRKVMGPASRCPWCKCELSG